LHLFWRATGFESSYIERLQKQLAVELARDIARHSNHADDPIAWVLLFEITCCQNLLYEAGFSRADVCGSNT
jgi:hypothetical protein